jgi:hypothetical protein
LIDFLTAWRRVWVKDGVERCESSHVSEGTPVNSAYNRENSDEGSNVIYELVVVPR